MVFRSEDAWSESGKLADAVAETLVPWVAVTIVALSRRTRLPEGPVGEVFPL